MSKAQLRQLLDGIAIQTLTSDEAPRGRVASGVTYLDHWLSPPWGAVLFLAEGETGLHFRGRAMLEYLDFAVDSAGRWIKRGGGGCGAGSAQEVLARNGPGLQEIGAGQHDDLRVVVALASSEVDSVEVRVGDISSRRALGVDGWCLLGATSQQPATHAQALAGATSVGRPLCISPSY